MISYLKRQDLYEISIGASEESYEEPSDWLNDSDKEIGAICLAISPIMHYLIDSIEYPKDIWTELDRNFGKYNEDNYSSLESTPRTTRVLSSKVSSSILSDEVVKDE